MEQLKAVADKLTVSYTESETTDTLTQKILAVTPTETQLKSMNVEQLKVLSDCKEMTYTYTNKDNLIALILAEYKE